MLENVAMPSCNSVDAYSTTLTIKLVKQNKRNLNLFQVTNNYAIYGFKHLHKAEIRKTIIYMIFIVTNFQLVPAIPVTITVNKF